LTASDIKQENSKIHWGLNHLTCKISMESNYQLKSNLIISFSEILAVDALWFQASIAICVKYLIKNIFV
jgi:hypothetical protein